MADAVCAALQEAHDQGTGQCRDEREGEDPSVDAHRDLFAPGGARLPLRDFCIEVDAEPFHEPIVHENAAQI